MLAGQESTLRIPRTTLSPMMKRPSRETLVPIGVLLLAATLVSGLVLFWWYFPKQESEVAKTTAISGLLAFFANVILAAITLVYVSLTSKSLDLLKEEREAVRTVVRAEVVAANANAQPVHGTQTTTMSLTAMVLLENTSAGKSTSVRLISAIMNEQPVQPIMLVGGTPVPAVDIPDNTVKFA